MPLLSSGGPGQDPLPVIVPMRNHVGPVSTLFHMDVVKIDWGMLHILQLFQKQVARVFFSVLDVSVICFICVF
jgi:hypothetical protein